MVKRLVRPRLTHKTHVIREVRFGTHKPAEATQTRGAAPRECHYPPGFLIARL